jgi:hypothetical protein
LPVFSWKPLIIYLMHDDDGVWVDSFQGQDGETTCSQQNPNRVWKLVKGWEAKSNWIWDIGKSIKGQSWRFFSHRLSIFGGIPSAIWVIGTWHLSYCRIFSPLFWKAIIHTHTHTHLRSLRSKEKRQGTILGVLGIHTLLP